MVKAILCPAKINLFLHILGKRNDGYHILESLVTFSNFGDYLSYSPKSNGSPLNITGEFAANLRQFNIQDNLILKAVTAFEKHFAITVKGDFNLEKKLPIASGIGGGSANAAGTIKLLMQHYSLSENTGFNEMLLSLGADVPVCYYGKNCIMSGIGEQLTPWPDLPNLHAVLVNPNVAVSTAKIFSMLNITNQLKPYKYTKCQILKVTNYQQYIDFINVTQNDMQIAAIKLCPQIDETLAELRKCEGIKVTQMSGSGATCFGLFETAQKASKAAAILSEKHSNWWVHASELGDVQPKV